LSAFNNYRLRLSALMSVLSIVMSAVLFAELFLIPLSSHISRPWLFSHPWLWRHSDDRTLLHLFINSWVTAIGMLLLSLGGLGKLRRVSILLSGANVVGFPTLFWAALVLSH
jgi:hypothetical protein